jgi:hypothetical protein
MTVAWVWGRRRLLFPFYKEETGLEGVKDCLQMTQPVVELGLEFR